MLLILFTQPRPMDSNSITDLLLLQNLVKRDPKSYRAEFLSQHGHYLSALQLYQLAPSKEHKQFSALIKFVAAVRPLFHFPVSSWRALLSVPSLPSRADPDHFCFEFALLISFHPPLDFCPPPLLVSSFLHTQSPFTLSRSHFL